jgi:hypothetical protein
LWDCMQKVNWFGASEGGAARFCAAFGSFSNLLVLSGYQPCPRVEFHGHTARLFRSFVVPIV